MKRRTWVLGTATGAGLALTGSSLLGQWGGSKPAARPGASIGTNLSGMEWAKPGLRHGASSRPNLHFSVPRKADIAWLAANGFTRNRLPIQWELLQPVLHDTQANAATRAIIGSPGQFHEGYTSFITDVLDAHAAAGIKCIIDCHNYCRYQDFRFQPDGSVIGLVKPDEALVRPYTEDRAQVQERIFSLAPGATLRQSHFTDFWARVAQRWKGHAGLGGYGLMNEPHDLPRPGETVASEGGGEDLAIWPAYARAAIDAIRAVDPDGLIYVAGNEWSAAMAMADKNPGFPFKGRNLVYEVHMYLDARSAGHSFDFDTEVGRNFSAGARRGPIHMDTGVDRLRPAVEWAADKGVKVALTEVGMPIDDPRWEEMYRRAVNYAWRSGCEVYSWMGGAHWPIRNYPINHVPGWHQNKTLEPAVSGPMKAAAGIASATLYDDGRGWAPVGAAVTITVYARGNLAAPVTLNVSADYGGSLSKTTLTIPAGANGQDSYTYTPAPNRVATLSYSSNSARQLPPPRKVYSLDDPVAHAADHLAEAAHALLAKYGASKWEMADGYTDFVQGGPAANGQTVRAVADSGFGSSQGNAMEMLNFINKDNPLAGPMALPVMRTLHGKKATDHTADNTFGLWCKKVAPVPGAQARPRNRVPYNLQDPHFAIAAISVPGASNSGVVFQASKAEEPYASELALNNGQPQARWIDSQGQQVVLTSEERLARNTPAVIALTCAPGAQTLRVNSAVAGRAGATLAPSTLAQMLIGWGFINYYPRDGFRGHVFAVIAGKGEPSAQELKVLERYLGTTAGLRA